MNAETRELWDYLQEVVSDYERYVSEIGQLGLAAPQLLYYRDEVQELLDAVKGNPQVDFTSVWLKIRKLDEVVRSHAQEIVDEIGHANFKQYQIINDPPKANWWWYLNRVTAAPAPPQNRMWELWRQLPELFTSEEQPDGEQTSEHEG